MSDLKSYIYCMLSSVSTERTTIFGTLKLSFVSSPLIK